MPPELCSTTVSASPYDCLTLVNGLHMRTQYHCLWWVRMLQRALKVCHSTSVKRILDKYDKREGLLARTNRMIRGALGPSSAKLQIVLEFTLGHSRQTLGAFRAGALRCGGVDT